MESSTKVICLFGCDDRCTETFNFVIASELKK